MARKLPASVLEAKGAFDKDPQRRRVDPVAVGEVGDAPAYFNAEQIVIWKEINEQLPPGLCKSADRMMVEVAVRLMHRFRTAGLASSELAQMINALGRLGLSPADRAKCSVPVDTKPQNSEFTEFV
jgi:hypothetical protein